MSAVIFKDSTLVRAFRNGISLNDLAYIRTGSTDPTAVAVDAPAGSLYLLFGGATGRLFLKNDAGSTTNWTEVANTAGVVATTYLQNNFLINSAFDYWQRGTVSATTGPMLDATNGSSQYGPDRWYMKNSLGTNGNLRFTRSVGGVAGSLYGCQLQIQTAPTAAQANGCELYQVLENQDSLRLLGKTASFSVQVKALTGVTQVGLQFFKAATEAKLTTAIGSEQVTNVGTGGFTLCKLEGVALDHVAAGVVGVRIRITGASGNLYALNNGFVVEQAMLNVGSTVGAFQRSGRNAAEEFLFCQRFFQKSYAPDTAPATSTAASAYVSRAVFTGSDFITLRFQVPMRSTPTIKIYSTNGTIDRWMDNTSSSNLVIVSGGSVGPNLAYLQLTGATATNSMQGHYTAEAEI